MWPHSLILLPGFVFTYNGLHYTHLNCRELQQAAAAAKPLFIELSSSTGRHWCAIMGSGGNLALFLTLCPCGWSCFPVGSLFSYQLTYALLILVFCLSTGGKRILSHLRVGKACTSERECVCFLKVLLVVWAYTSQNEYAFLICAVNPHF